MGKGTKSIWKKGSNQRKAARDRRKEAERSTEIDGNEERSDSENDKTKAILTQLIFDGIAYAQLLLRNMIACEHLAFTTSHSFFTFSLPLSVVHFFFSLW